MLKALNEAQLEAVKHIDGPLLILAGAGSGKTKTITVRLAYLLAEVGIPPENTLTLTFTNKAASEMRERAIELIGDRVSHPPLLCTFHKFCLLFLKSNINRLGRDNNFVIIDSNDKKKLIRKLAKDLKIDLNISFLASEISKYKNTLLTPQEVLNKAELLDYKQAAKLYQKYQENIQDNNLVDFDDLLMLTYNILKDNDDLSKEISQRYQYIMVDEYQDTNELQYRLLRLLCSEHNNLCVVGDDDQSIYSWRGANIRNILEFHENFDKTNIIKLEVNYRSTQPILEAANTLIEHNGKRIGKKLTSYRCDGEEIELLNSLDESHESRNIAREIKKLLNQGVAPDEIAVLYRVNALSRSLEEGFKKENLPFKLIGGISFYERTEIKDIVSYFRLLINRDDNISFVEIVNKPKRGLGKISIEKLQNFAETKGLSLYQCVEDSTQEELGLVINKKVAKTLKEFNNTIDELRSATKESLKSFIDFFEEKIGLKDYYKSRVDDYERILNIDEFYGYFIDFIDKNPELNLNEFLNENSLHSNQDEVEENSVTIMNIHASKGLEFEHLFIIGMEEEFFPLLGKGRDIEEERRLGYVAITRAKSHLTLCYADSRFYKGKRKQLKKSRFLGETGLIRSSLKVTKSAEYKRGDLVKHKIFGIGRVQAVNKSGKDYKLRINFGGVKKDILSSFVQRV